ncbi:MAG: creatininase family protein [Gemmatimonadota bacterium]
MSCTRSLSCLASAVALLALSTPTAAQSPSARSMVELNWMEVAELVPSRIETVLLSVGTLEAHGVTANGADILVPDSLAARLAADLDALIAPTINYGVNTSLDEYPGTFGVSEETLRGTALEVFRGLAATGFRNIIVLNGHGPNFAPLNDAARVVFRETDARILVVNWWSITPDITEDVFGAQGGHAGNNETAAVLAVRPDLVHEDRYTGEDQATPFGTGWQAWPFPSTIGLYTQGQGYPEFDEEQARRYFDRVVERVRELALDVIAKWDAAGI